MSGPLNLVQILNFLLDTPMFSVLDEGELSDVVHIMSVQHLRAGQVLFEEGRPGAAWYVVYDGEIEVVKQGREGERVLGRLGAHRTFGEMSVLDGSARSATARAVTDTTVLKFPREAFQELVARDHVAALKLVHQMALVLVARQREATARLVEFMDLQDDEQTRSRIARLVKEATTSE